MKKNHPPAVDTFLYTALARVVRIMKLTTALLIIGCLHVSAKGLSQEEKVTLTLTNASIPQLFKSIEKLTGYRFAYSNDILPRDFLVTISVKETPVSSVLRTALLETGLKFKLIDNEVIIISKDLNGAAAITISGTVTNEAGTPLPGVSVYVKGLASVGTVTNEKGFFKLDVPQEASVLVFSSIDMQTTELPISGSSEINVVMKRNITEQEEVVIIGYGTQRKKDLTGSISTVDPKVLNKIASNDVLKAMQGQVAGVSVTSGGQPGAAPAIKIRGIGNFSNNNPLYIIDGVQAPVNDLVIADVETIQVLKDGSAAAIYGSRAANGVIIITTKRGKSGKFKLDYNGYYGVQNIVKRYDVANTQQYQQLVNEASANADPVQLVKPANDPGSSLYVKDINTDWQEEAFKTGNIQEHTVGISGGTDAAKYYVSINYFDHTGTVAGKGPAYNRYSFRINTDFKQGRFRFGESFSYAKINQRFMTFLHDGNILGYIVNAIPTLPVYDSTTRDGFSSASQTIHGSYTANAIGFNNVLDSRTERFRFIGNAYGEYEIIKGLKYKLSLGYERTDWRDFYFVPVHDLGWFYVNNIAKLNDWRGSGNTGTIENTLTYDKVVGRHSLNALVGQSTLESNLSRSFAHAEGFTQPYLPVLSNGTSGITATGDLFKSRLSSYFGRVNYIYDDRYLLTATIRRDGSSRFAPQNRWGNFPSLALGWKLHNEQWFQKLLPAYVNQLKLRASYGELGNQEIGDYQYQAFINSYAHAVFGNQLALGATQTTFAVPDIKWETMISRNIGIDVELFKKLTFSAEYFHNTGKDILLRVQIPGSTGVYPGESPVVNGASIQNSGFEFQLGYADKKGSFSYNINANVSTLRNEVLSLGYGDNPIYGYGNLTKTEVGREVGELYGWVIDGIFQNQAEIDALNAKSPIKRYQEELTRPGDYRFRDLNGRDANGKLTGAPDGKIDDDDRTYLGSAIPDLYYGLNASVSYKQFDLSVVASGVSGNKIFNSIRAGIESGAGWDNYGTKLLNRWTPTNTNTDVPRVVMFDPNKNARNSARWLENGSFFRITTLQVGYTLPQQILQRAHLSNLRIYITAQNLVTFTKYTGFDPDFANNNGLFDRAIDNGSYPNRPFTANEAGGLPNPRSFLFGLQLGL
ncbi:SusC/RagA family TonB-linked outer membrane protein [Longitalea luteola]|uniref:SusC/RagA family TonB-linked outer membrane protein n=1 Tax=Longitalea luteola TaxID=2812563 RepID=UPI001A95E6B8|nr:TonB-dependent receptor [Longitalea luteola]